MLSIQHARNMSSSVMCIGSRADTSLIPFQFYFSTDVCARETPRRLIHDNKTTTITYMAPPDGHDGARLYVD